MAEVTKFVVSRTSFPDVDGETFTMIMNVHVQVKPECTDAYRRGYNAFFRPETIVDFLTLGELEGYKAAEQMETQRRRVARELSYQTLNQLPI